MYNESKRLYMQRYRALHRKVRKPPRFATKAEYNFWNRYGITFTERDAILKRQGNKCAACGSDTSGSRYGWQMDHCHRTNKLREVVCLSCNVALGRVKDNPDHLRKLIRYLENHHGTHPSM